MFITYHTYTGWLYGWSHITEWLDNWTENISYHLLNVIENTHIMEMRLWLRMRNTYKFPTAALQQVLGQKIILCLGQRS